MYTWLSKHQRSKVYRPFVTEAFIQKTSNLCANWDLNVSVALSQKNEDNKNYVCEKIMVFNGLQLQSDLEFTASQKPFESANRGAT